jgi:hypothetical protein
LVQLPSPIIDLSPFFDSYAKLGRIPPAPLRDVADILMATVSGLLLQGAEAPANVRKPLISEATMLILGITT